VSKAANATSSLVRISGGTRVVLASELSIADDFISRSVGLLKNATLPEGQGLWIKRCNSIHTFFMRFAIDAVFVDKKLQVVSVYRDLRPWRITRLYLKASSVIELPSGTLDATISPGDLLAVETGGPDG
jgi:uncharacterized membrane protein (UPF0127 family)